MPASPLSPDIMGLYLECPPPSGFSAYSLPFAPRAIKIARTHSPLSVFSMARPIRFIFTTCSPVGFIFLVHHRSSTHLETSITLFHFHTSPLVHVSSRYIYPNVTTIVSPSTTYAVIVSLITLSYTHLMLPSLFISRVPLDLVHRLLLRISERRRFIAVSFLLSFRSLKSFQRSEVMYIMCLSLFHIAVRSRSRV